MGDTVVSSVTSSYELLNEWYKAIISHDVIKAKELKEHISPSEIEREGKTSLLLYFSLLNYRYCLMDKVNSINFELNIDPHQLDDQLKYYFFFFNGIHATNIGKYRDARRYFSLAEKYLNQLIDDVERAEYHYKVSDFYYNVLQPIPSIKHALKAKKLFESANNYGYVLKIAGIENILGLNYILLGSYEDAKKHFNKSLALVRSFGEINLEASVHSNIGLLYSEQGLSDLAIKHFYQTLSVQPNNYKNIFLLSRELFRKGEIDLSLKFISKGLDLCDRLNIEEYVHHFKILYAKIFNTNLENAIEDGIVYFEKEGLYGYVEEYSSELAHIFFSMNDYAKSSLYFVKASDAKEKKGVF